MKKIILGIFLILSSICFAEIPKGSKVLYYETTRSAGTLANKLQEISNQYTIIDWQISIGSSASNYHGGRNYIFASGICQRRGINEKIFISNRIIFYNIIIFN